MSNIKPESASIAKFEKAFLAGERSDHAIHKGLIEILSEFGRDRDHSTAGIWWTVRFMADNGRNGLEGHRAASIVEYLKRNGFRISMSDAGELSVGLKRKAVFDTAWLAECKRVPWYKVAREMQTVKAWSDPLEAVITQYATGYIMGDISRRELTENFAPKLVDTIIAKAMSDDNLQARAAKRMAKLVEQEAA